MCAELRPYIYPGYPSEVWNFFLPLVAAAINNHMFDL